MANPNADPERSKSNELHEILFNKLFSIENIFTELLRIHCYIRDYNGGTGYTNNQNDLNKMELKVPTLTMVSINQDFITPYL